jgi:hypothetical protein
MKEFVIKVTGRGDKKKEMFKTQFREVKDQARRPRTPVARFK